MKKRQPKQKTSDIAVGTTLTEDAYRTLKWAILRGDLREGSFLSETEATQRYGISRTPFREACNRLHYEELLEVVPRRGYLVSKIGFTYVRDLFEMRQMIEGMVAEMAALRAEDSQIEELAAMIPRTPAKRESSDVLEVETLIRANSDFHLALAKMTQNAELVKLVRMILERSERIAYIEYRCIRFQWSDLGSMHYPIVEALRAHDPIATRQAVLRDITDAQISTIGQGTARKPVQLSNSAVISAMRESLGEVLTAK
jgi:DNA-binding GntR family transcriptional regulator